MACVMSIKARNYVGGEKMIRGNIAMSDSYTTGGDPLNMINEFAQGSEPTVVIGQADGYTMEWNLGAADTGGVIVRYSVMNGFNGAVFNTALLEIPSATNISTTTAQFIAWGQPANI